jgi:hypothetical protein
MRSRILNASMDLKNAKAEFALLFVLRARIFDYVIYFHHSGV